MQTALPMSRRPSLRVAPTVRKWAHAGRTRFRGGATPRAAAPSSRTRPLIPHAPGRCTINSVPSAPLLLHTRIHLHLRALRRGRAAPRAHASCTRRFPCLGLEHCNGCFARAPLDTGDRLRLRLRPCPEPRRRRAARIQVGVLRPRRGARLMDGVLRPLCRQVARRHLPAAVVVVVAHLPAPRASRRPRRPPARRARRGAGAARGPPRSLVP